MYDLVRRVIVDVGDSPGDIAKRMNFEDEIRKDYGANTKALFPGAEDRIDGNEDTAQQLIRFAIVTPPPGRQAGEFAADLTTRYGKRGVTAYPELLPCRPPVTGLDPYRKQQRYLDAAPVGIGAEKVWPRSNGAGVPGADGTGVRIVDIEQGWALDHEDLEGAAIQLLPCETNYSFFGHGTAVLGILVAVDNGTGGVGIVPNADVYLANQYALDSTHRHLTYNTAESIWRAVLSGVFRRGDVLLLEAQLRHRMFGFLPVEAEPCVHRVIRFLTDCLGVVVVEPAGNGGRILDDVVIGGVNPFDENARRSGAVMVGAGRSTTRTRMWDSNFGTRVDCFAWGDNITTCGDGEHGTDPSDYRTTFGGTSGAAAIVAGAAVLAQCIRRSKHAVTLTPSEMRAQLTFEGPSSTVTKVIGVMPDVEQIANRP